MVVERREKIERERKKKGEIWNDDDGRVYISFSSFLFLPSPSSIPFIYHNSHHPGRLYALTP